MDSSRIVFITTITTHREPIFRREATANLLIETLTYYRDQGKYLLHEFVVMPDHLHALLTPGDEISLERTMQFIKGGFSFRLKFRGPAWQPSFTNHRIRDADDYEHHRNYIRLNPVRAKLVAVESEYLYSSSNPVFRRDDPPLGLKPRLSEPA